MNSFPYAIIAFYVFLFGLCIGSFLNVVILRGLKNESFITGRSKCPKCNNQLKWYMNIPLLSYIFLRGKCAFCKAPISIQYPIVEFVTGALFLAAFLAFGFTIKTLFLFFAFPLFIALCVTDIKEMVIIDAHTYILLAISLLYSLSPSSSINFVGALIGAIAGYVIFELLARIGVLLVNYRAFGEGDSLIALGLGAIFGLKNLLVVIYLAILLNVLFLIPFLSIKLYKEKNIPKASMFLMAFLLIIYSTYVAQNNIEFNFIQMIGMWIIAISVVVFLIADLKNRLKDDEPDEENLSQSSAAFFMPFGPALVVSATICIFYLPQVKNLAITAGLIDFVKGLIERLFEIGNNIINIF